ncbi:hypothetical protein PS3A_45940 [Pseudomonas sp. 3A(2025)]
MSLDKKLVCALYSELFDDNFERYKAALNKPIEGGQDAYAKARNALALLDEAKRSDVINFLRLVIADTASTILSTLDGVHFPDDWDEDCVLSCAGKEIQGDLADLFIEKGEHDGIYD